MNPIRPMSQQILRFSGIHNKVLEQLETNRLKQDSQDLFKEQLDVFVKRNPNEDKGTVELVANQENSKSLPYGSGFIRNLHRLMTGQDIQPTTEIQAEKAPVKTPEPSQNLFKLSTESQN